MIIEIIPTGNGSDVDLVINGEWQHTFDSTKTAIESLKLDYWQNELDACSFLKAHRPYTDFNS